MTVYVAREIWDDINLSITESEYLIGVFSAKTSAEKAATERLEEFFEWYRENKADEDYDYEKEEAAERENLQYEFNFLDKEDGAVEYCHEWYPYCIVIDKVEVE